MTDNKPFAKTIYLDNPQCDLSGHMALPQLFLQMQEVAGGAVERLGHGADFVTRENIFWVLSRVELKVFRMPACSENISISTWHGPNVRFIYPRFFHARDQGGNLLVEASTLWMLIDRDKREIVFPSMRGYTLPDPPQGLPQLKTPGRIEMPCELDRLVTRSPLYSDFDVNGHMNNARYPLWVCDLFPPSSFMQRFVSAMQVNYIKEIVEGEQVSLHFGTIDDHFGVRGEVDGECRFEACGSFSRYA